MITRIGKRVAALLCGMLVSVAASAGVTAIDIVGSANGVGNWTGEPSYYVRAILVDSNGQPVGTLSPAATLYIGGNPIYPSAVDVTLDADAPGTSFIRVYRSTSQFNGGSPDIEYADYHPCPCTTGTVSIGSMPDGDFTAAGATLPVTLQSFLVH